MQEPTGDTGSKVDMAPVWVNKKSVFSLSAFQNTHKQLLMGKKVLTNQHKATHTLVWEDFKDVLFSVCQFAQGSKTWKQERVG